MPTGRRNGDKADERVPLKEQAANGYGGALSAILRLGSGLITPAGLIAAVLFLAGLDSDLDRNCKFTQALAYEEQINSSNARERDDVKAILRTYNCK